MAHSRAPQTNVLDDAFSRVQLDLVSHAKGFVGIDGDRAEKIGQSILRR